MIPKRIVLDTNVCLDLFVFRDSRWSDLHASLRNGSAQAFTREDCRMEWLIVLNYPHFLLDESGRMAAITEFDSLISRIEMDTICSETRLPVCRDPDDQKFLELTRDANAEVLITKDKALLKLAKRTAKAGLFMIMPPEAWADYYHQTMQRSANS